MWNKITCFCFLARIGDKPLLLTSGRLRPSSGVFARLKKKSHFWPMVLNVLGYQFHLLCNVVILLMPVVITKDLPISPRFSPHKLLSRCKFSTLTTRQPVTMVEFDLTTLSRFPFLSTITLQYYGKPDQKSCFDNNRTHGIRTN